MKVRWEETIAAFERDVRDGKLTEVRFALGQLSVRSLARESKLRLANLARRCDLPQLALRLLMPVVRPSARSVVVPTDEEKAEYAVALSKIGALDEAERLAAEVDARSFPEALLARCAALVSRWDYGATIPLLRTYVSAPGLDDYRRIIGRVNLLAALVFVDDADVERELTETLRLTLDGKLENLFAKSQVLGAQWRLGKKDIAGARRYLAGAQPTVTRMGGLDEFLLRKWLAIVEASADTSALVGIDAIRAEAVAREHWETVRQCDAYSALLLGDETKWQSVYFATPFEAFRSWLSSTMGRRLSIPDEYTWRSGSGGPRVRVANGELGPGELRPKAGLLPHRLLTVLVSDRYRPFRLPALAFRLYPDEFYHPTTTPERVKQVLKQLRSWLDKNKVPLHIDGTDGQYRLSAIGPCTVILDTELSPKNRAGALEEELLRRLDGPSTADEIADRLSISTRSVRRLLAEAKEKGIVRETRDGRERRYTKAS